MCAAGSVWPASGCPGRLHAAVQGIQCVWALAALLPILACHPSVADLPCVQAASTHRLPTWTRHCEQPAAAWAPASAARCRCAAGSGCAAGPIDSSQECVPRRSMAPPSSSHAMRSQTCSWIAPTSRGCPAILGCMGPPIRRCGPALTVQMPSLTSLQAWCAAAVCSGAAGTAGPERAGPEGHRGPRARGRLSRAVALRCTVCPSLCSSCAHAVPWAVQTAQGEVSAQGQGGGVEVVARLLQTTAGALTGGGCPQTRVQTAFKEATGQGVRECPGLWAAATRQVRRLLRSLAPDQQRSAQPLPARSLATLWPTSRGARARLRPKLWPRGARSGRPARLPRQQVPASPSGACAGWRPPAPAPSASCCCNCPVRSPADTCEACRCAARRAAGCQHRGVMAAVAAQSAAHAHAHALLVWAERARRPQSCGTGCSGSWQSWRRSPMP